MASANQSTEFAVHDTGITVLNNPASADTDIIFIHGIQGNPRRTWTSKGPSKTFWPLDLLPTDCPNTRIMTFGYDSVVTRGLRAVNQNDIFAHAQNLRRELARKRRDCTERPIIFVAHSLGGILLEDVLRLASKGSAPQEEKDIYLSTLATIFLGTPFRGSNAAEWALIADSFVKMIGLGTNNKVLKELKLDTGVLNILRSEFRECVKQGAINVRVFQESKGLSGIRGFNEQIVLEYSSKLDDDTVTQSLNYSHMDMCRYATRDDEGYRVVGDEIAYWAGKASEFHGHYSRVNETGLQNIPGRPVFSSTNSVLTSQEIFDTSEETLRAFLRPATVGDDLDDLLDRRDHETGLWIFETQALRDWLSGATSNIWITGKAGSGKSTLAATIIDRLKTDGHMVAYFFCRFQDDTKQNLSSILGTWTWQILEQYPQFTEIVLRHQPKGSGIRGQEARVKAILEILLTASPNRIFLIVDGLDECESAKEVSKKLQQFISAVGSHHSFLIVSRKEECDATQRPSMYSGIGTRPQLFRLVPLAVSDTASDIERYLKTRVSLLHLSAELERTVLTKLTQRVNGMFLWAEFQINALAEQFLQEDARMVLEKELPDGLEATYDRMLHTIMAVSNLSRRSRTLRILQWITAATRTLTLEELDFALGIKLDAKYSPQRPTLMRGGQDVIQACGSFVEISRKEIRLIHASAKEFLMSKGVHLGLGISQPGNSTEEALNAMHIARACLTCLAFSDIPYVGGTASNDDLSLRIQNHIRKHPFLEYAALNWWKHLTDMPQLEQETLSSTIGRFLGPSEHVVKWLQLYQYFTQVRSQRQSFHPRHNPCWPFISNFWETALGFNPAGLIDRWERWLIEIWYAPGLYWPIAHIAAFFDFQRVLQHELSIGVSVDFRDGLGFTPLLQAAHGDSKNAAMTLLDHGADVNGRTKYGYSAIRYACRNAVGVLPILLERSARLEFADYDTGKTALHEACSSVLWHPLIFKSIMEAPNSKELINSKSVITGETPLNLAAAIAVEPSATLFRERYRRAKDPIYPQSNAKLGMPTCELFSAQGYRALQVLRNAWADLGIQTPFRNTVDCFLKMAAAWKGRLIQDLLRYGADANIADHHERLPLHRAISSMEPCEEVSAVSRPESMPVAALIRSTQELDHLSKLGRTPLQITMYKKLYATSLLLIQYGAGCRTFTAEELRAIVAGAAKPHSLAPTQPAPWTQWDKHSTMEVLNTISVLRLLQPRLPDPVISIILDHAELWTETEYCNTFRWCDADEYNWPKNAILVSEEIAGAGQSPVRQLTVQAQSRDYDPEYPIYHRAMHWLVGFSGLSAGSAHYVRHRDLSSRRSGSSRKARVNEPASVMLQVAVIRKEEPTTLEYGPDLSSALSSTVIWNSSPDGGADKETSSWLKALKTGDRIVITLHPEAASFDISLISVLRLTVRTSWLSAVKPKPED